MPSRKLPKNFMLLNARLQCELKKQTKEHPNLPRKYAIMISADHIRAKQTGKRSFG